MENGVWRTIRGRRVFIRDGEDLESAMKRSGKFGTKFSPEETENLRKTGREARAREIDKINNDNKYITENEQKDELKEISGGAISTLQTTTPRSKAERLKPGAEIYYKGDQANTPGYFTVEKFEPEKEQFLSSITLKEKGGENRTLKIGSQSIEDNYTNNYASRFAFKEDYDNYRNQVFENYRKIAEDAKNKTIHTQSGSYSESELKSRDESIKQMYKDAWNGDKSYKDLHNEIESMKSQGKISQGELDSLQYDASRELGTITESKNKTVKLPDGTPIDQNYVKDLYSGMSYEEVKRQNDFDKEWMENVKPEARPMQTAKVEETDKYLASMERYESRISDEEYGKKDWGDGVYPFSEGTAWKGTKSGERLSTKEIAKAVTDKMKEAYPGVKIGRKTSYYSGGSSADFNIVSSDKPIVRDISDFSDTEISRLYNKGYNSNWYKTEGEFKEHLQKELTSGNFDVNQYYIDDDYRLTPYGKQVIKDLKKVSDAYNYDESDGMTDYFNTGFYSDISIGSYKKPFVQGDAIQSDKKVQAKVERFKERKGSSYDTMSKRQLAEKIVDDQIARGVIKGDNKEKIIKSKMRDYSKNDLLDYFK